jgi:hypothetical protein
VVIQFADAAHEASSIGVTAAGAAIDELGKESL